MASAEREPTRAVARVESESVRDQHLGAGGRIVSLAFWRFHRAEIAQDPAHWLVGLNAGLRGCNYVYPTGLRDFIEGAALRVREGNDGRKRLRHLASFRLSRRFGRPLWDWGPWR
jgi:hypothetical protein